MFRLNRYYSIASLLGIVVVVVILSYLYNHFATQSLINHETRHNVSVAKSFINSTWNDISNFVALSSNISNSELKNHPQTNQLHNTLIKQMHGLNVVKVKVYNPEGITVFSTDPRQISEDKSKNKGFIHAMSGFVASEITFRDEFDAFEHYIVDRDLVFSYIPVRKNNDDSEPIIAVMELYSDVTPLVKIISNDRIKIVSSVSFIMVALYLFLFVIVRHANNIIVQQHKKRNLQEKETIVAKEEAEFANRSKSELLSRMSHELRTPMNAILGFSQLLQIDDDNLTDEQKESVDYIMKGGVHLLSLINEVLDISEIDAGGMVLQMEAVSLDSAINSAVLLTRSLTSKRNIKLQSPPETNLCVIADRQRLKQVLVNLISNAIKYNHEGGYVLINVSPATSGKVRISIIDNGFGIESDNKEILFEPFHRFSDQKENIEGTGIGLSVTKKLVKLMNGRIGVESEYKVGSTFWVEFPKTDDVDKKTDLDLKVTSADRDDKHKTILYIEDNYDNLMLMKRMLEKATAYKLLSASTAEVGIDIAKVQKPDLILMDIGLPGMDGFEALHVLKSDERTAHIPVIAVSADAMKEQVNKGEAADFTAYVTKPISIDQLLKEIE